MLKLLKGIAYITLIVLLFPIPLLHFLARGAEASRRLVERGFGLARCLSGCRQWSAGLQWMRLAGSCHSVKTSPYPARFWQHTWMAGLPDASFLLDMPSYI